MIHLWNTRLVLSTLPGCISAIFPVRAGGIVAGQRQLGKLALQRVRQIV
jgi:hypothetical protein